MRQCITLIWVAAVVAAVGTSRLWADEPAEQLSDQDIAAIVAKVREAASSKTDGPPEKKYRNFDELTQGAEKFEGLFTLHKKDQNLYIEIKPSQFGQEFLAPIVIARGQERAGQPLDVGAPLVFRRVGDTVQVIRRNIGFKAPPNTPLEKAVQQNYTDSILLALPIVSINPRGQTVVVDLADIFLKTDFAQLGLGPLDRSRTTWYKVKAFENNIELQVEATYGGGSGRAGRSFGGTPTATADSRGITLVIHYSLTKMPPPGYKPRYADPRVGLFLDTVKDLGSDNPDTNYVRMINRWRLEKADPRAKLSPPKKQITWWIEDTVPIEYRPYVEEGILEWNKAFEKIGFRNALAVRWQEPGDEFDPEDINYCTFRWITTSRTFAMSALRSNPLTGEMIDGDVIFDASWIRAWKEQYAFMTGVPIPTASGELMPTWAIGEVISPMLAEKRGFGRPFPVGQGPNSLALLSERYDGRLPDLVASEWTPEQHQLDLRLNHDKHDGYSCQHSLTMQYELGLAAIALASAGKAEPDVMLPEDFIGQAIKDVVMHEVGHSLGLRHNFKASTMLTADQLHDTTITREQGISGSVMDYNAINLAPEGVEQGDFFMTTIGPYDYWAIEYAYAPITGNEEEELRKIAARSPDPELAFATDEDVYSSHDPLINRRDLGADPLHFAKERADLACLLFQDLDAAIVKEGEAWDRVGRAFSVLMGQLGNSSTIASAYIGGQSVSRDFKGGDGSRDPVDPIPGDKQREALAFLVDCVFNGATYDFSPSLMRRASGGRYHSDGSRGVTIPVYERVLGIQKIALDACLDPDTLTRLQNQEIQIDPEVEPLRLAELFRALTDGIWSELDAKADGDACCDETCAAEASTAQAAAQANGDACEACCEDEAEAATVQAQADDCEACCEDEAEAAQVHARAQTNGEVCCDEACEAQGNGLTISTIRRNLQREHLRRLGGLVLGHRRNSSADLFPFVVFADSGNAPADARSLARLHLKQIGERIGQILDQEDLTIDDTTRAHLEECRHGIARILDAGLTANEL